MQTRSFVPAALALAMLAGTTAVAAQELFAMPVLPAYGEAVAIEVRNADWPMYLPATRYSRTGWAIDIEYEYITDGFGPIRPDFGFAPSGWASWHQATTRSARGCATSSILRPRRWSSRRSSP
jgi:hypothetical protein